jgi:uncharacterized protein (DUF4213/DUF364 family)
LSLRPVLEEVREKIQTIIAAHTLGEEPVKVAIGTLTAKQAIGSPTRQDYALLEGREVMIEAQFKGSYGQAFTDRPQEFTGHLKDVISLDLNSNSNRAVFLATLNAVMAHLGMATAVRHCRDEEPEECASEIAQYILDKYGKVRVGMIGYQPAILDNLVRTFGADNVRCTDLNPKNTDSMKSDIKIWDGRTETGRLADWSDLLLATSSTITNNTYDNIRAEANAKGKILVIFGVTGAGVAGLLGLERVCFKAH